MLVVLVTEVRINNPHGELNVAETRASEEHSCLIHSVEASLFLTYKIFKDSCFSQLTRSLHTNNLQCFYARLLVLKWILTMTKYLILAGLELEGKKETRIEEQRVGSLSFL